MLKPVSVIARPENRVQTLAVEAVNVNATRPSLLADYATLFKLRVSTMVVITSAAGFYLGCLRSVVSPIGLGTVEALAGIAVVTCGSSALNQAMERKTDRLQRRTCNRPMATGRIGLVHGVVVGVLTILLGSLYLARVANPLAGALTLATAVGYVAVYTPLKRISTINTFIGAIPGAMPPLIGWVAARGRVEWPAIALFAILFIWQFPHFMAIGWMYREDFARAGIRISATIEDTHAAVRSTVTQALLYAALMIPVSLWPFALGTTGVAYAVSAGVLSLGYLWMTLRFTRIVNSPDLHDVDAPSHRQPARDLLHASILYLPLLLAAMMLDARGRWLL
jgi:protoheme IX farnesyltransferase